MQYRPLGKSPLQVSALCLCTMMFGDQTDLAEARNIAGHAREHGVNFIDTADVYSLGKSEAMVGELLQGARHDWILATKDPSNNNLNTTVARSMIVRWT